MRTLSCCLLALLAPAAADPGDPVYDSSISPPPPYDASAPQPLSTRFVFADGEGGSGLWSHLADITPRYANARECPKDGFVSFHWPGGTHDLVKMKDFDHFDRCDFTGAVMLAPQGSVGSTQSYYVECTNPGSEYLSCSIPEHCAAGQKLEVKTASKSVFNADGSTALHADSLKDVMTLLGARVPAFEGERPTCHCHCPARVLPTLCRSNRGAGAPEMDRGYQTDAQAEHTLEVIWCLGQHTIYACKDWQVRGDETR